MNDGQDQTKTYTNPIDDWYFNKFLPLYEKRERVEPARKLLHIHKPPQEILDQILRWVELDNEHRKQCRATNTFRPERPNCYTFFSEARWQDALPKIDNKGAVQYASRAVMCNGGENCLADVMWCNQQQGLNLCIRHYEKLVAPKVDPLWQRRQEHMERLGLLPYEEETDEQYRARIRGEYSGMLKKFLRRAQC